jgi:hypothetical protein
MLGFVAGHARHNGNQKNPMPEETQQMKVIEKGGRIAASAAAALH